MKVQISVNDDLMKKADDYVADNYISRSTLVSLALNEYLTSREMVKYLREISYSMRKIADTGEVDAETISQLEDLERILRVMNNQKA